jgi:hypothetical protein
MGNSDAEARAKPLLRDVNRRGGSITRAIQPPTVHSYFHARTLAESRLSARIVAERSRVTSSLRMGSPQTAVAIACSGPPARRQVEENSSVLARARRCDAALRRAIDGKDR